MGIFDLFKKKEKEETPGILVMAMFNNNETYDLSKLTAHLKSNWNLQVKESFEGNSAVLEINNICEVSKKIKDFSTSTK